MQIIPGLSRLSRILLWKKVARERNYWLPREQALEMKTNMKEPNKIFLAFEHEFVAQSSTTEKDANGNSIFLPELNPIEYVRKDALLEIIENAREAAIVQRNFNNRPAEQEARIDAYDFIKHRIESL